MTAPDTPADPEGTPGDDASARGTAPGDTRAPGSDTVGDRAGLVWLAGAATLLAPEVGALVGLVGSLLSVEPLIAAGDAIPTLVSRETIPNRGVRLPDGTWRGPFLGLSPAAAWALRVVVAYLYAAVWLGWLWRGYDLYRRRYRRRTWTPRDDVIRRFRRHRWGQFGLVVVLLFLVLAAFAPALGPTTMERNVFDPYSHEVQTYDEDAGEVQTVSVGQANLQAVSQGIEGRNVPPLTYDEFGRYHPFGTLPSGQDLFTTVAAGARVSLFVGTLAITVSALVAVTLAMVGAYYGGVVDLAIVLLGDATQALPQLLVVILLSVVLSETWIASIYSGGVLLALIFALTGWPSLWRAIRGPALQVSERTWVDAADSFGQRPRTTMRRHVLPYVAGYVMVYASMNFGGIVIGIAGLSFLGLGISPPTPEWGRIVDVGQPYLTTASWHVAVIPGLLVVLVVTGFNALGDGIRDAIDAETDLSEEGETSAAASGAGG